VPEEKRPNVAVQFSWFAVKECVHLPRLIIKQIVIWVSKSATFLSAHVAHEGIEPKYSIIWVEIPPFEKSETTAQ